MFKKVLLIIAVAAFVFACGGGGDETASNSSKPKKEKIAAVDGKKIYSKNCVVCHGVYGDMGASGSFDLTKSELSTDEKIAVVTNGRNAMAAYKEVLSEAEIKAVAEYTNTLKN